MTEYVEERPAAGGDPFLSPIVLIIGLLILAALAWLVFAGPRGETNQNQPVIEVTTPSSELR